MVYRKANLLSHKGKAMGEKQFFDEKKTGDLRKLHVMRATSPIPR
jgi:hypothetical protein